MAVQIGRKYEENLKRIRDLAKLAIGDSGGGILVHLYRDHDNDFEVLIAPSEVGSICYECKKRINANGVFVIVTQDSKRETYFFHISHLF